MNARAYDFALMHRDELTSLRGASSITFHAQKAWFLMLIIADSDEAVISLSEEFDLTLQIESAKGWWRRIAVGQRNDGALRCLVSGPRARGQPPDIRTERAMATAPVTAEQVLARVRNVATANVFATVTGERLILIASLGLDLGRDDVRAVLFDLHRRGELRLVNLSNSAFVRTDLGPQGLRFDPVDESAFREGVLIPHAVVLA